MDNSHRRLADIFYEKIIFHFTQNDFGSDRSNKLPPFRINYGALEDPVPDHINNLDYDCMACVCDDVVQFLQYDAILGISFIGEEIVKRMRDLFPCRKREVVWMETLKRWEGSDQTNSAFRYKGKRILPVGLTIESETVLGVIRSLQDNGCIVKDIAVLIDPQNPGSRILRDSRIAVHSAFSEIRLIHYYCEKGWINSEKLKECEDYLKRR